MKSAAPRRNSLRPPPQPPHIPVPPSLKQSPYLNAPIFQREIPSPRLPSEEDERWLQDTVPVSSDNVTSSCRQSAYPSSGPVSPTTDSTPSSPSPGLSRGQSQVAKYLAHSLAPPPQPSVDGRPAHLYQVHSEPDILRLSHPSSDPVYIQYTR